MPFSGVRFYFYSWILLDIWQDSLGGGSVQRQGLYLHTGQHKQTETQTHIHAPSRIRTWDPNVRAAEDSTCLRPRGYWDRHSKQTLYVMDLNKLDLGIRMIDEYLAAA
jgi:hypothetical protein